MTVWFTSDQHYGHRNIIEYCNRPYSSVEDMSQKLVANFNSKVQSNDICYHLGDFALSFSFVEEIMPQLNGQHYLICGNHDACWPERGKAGQFLVSYLKYFSDVFIYKKLIMNDKIWWLGHQPPIQSEQEKGKYRFPQVRKSDILLHGHVHNSWKKQNNLINVGVDVWNYYPVSEVEIAEIIK